MFCCSNEDLLISIYDAAKTVSEEYGEETLKYVLGKFNAKCVDDLRPSDYEAVFSDLYLMATDD